MWTNEVVLRLIDLYRSYECLWDTTNDGYKNKLKKNETWEELALAMNLPRREVEMKIHSLRSQFIRERKKIKIAVENGGPVKTSTWFAYGPLMFLVKDDYGIDTIIKHDLILNQDSQSTNESEIETNQTLDTTNLETELQYEIGTRNIQKNVRKRPHEDVFNSTSRYTPEIKRYVDEFDIYGQYVASELRHVKSERAMLTAKYYINNIIIDARLGKFDSTGLTDSVNTRAQYYNPESSKANNVENLVVEIKCEHDE